MDPLDKFYVRSEKMASAQALDTVIVRYGLSKEAANFLGTLANAGSRALASGMKAYQNGGGTLAQNVGQGLHGAGMAFQRAGGLPAAGKAALGLGAVGAGFAAGRMTAQPKPQQPPQPQQLGVPQQGPQR